LENESPIIYQVREIPATMPAKQVTVKASNAAGCVFTLMIFAAAVWLLKETGANVPLSIIVFLLLILLIYTFKKPGARTLNQIDLMPGEEFEHLVAQLLKRQGYQAEVTKSSGDLGVDVVARHGQDRIAVQVKRQEKPVSRRAVSDAVAGMPAYECTAAMVVTNNSFTDGAKSLADLHGCELADRDTLALWIGKQGRALPMADPDRDAIHPGAQRSRFRNVARASCPWPTEPRARNRGQIIKDPIDIP
jgi:restriction system protein